MRNFLCVMWLIVVAIVTASLSNAQELEAPAAEKTPVERQARLKVGDTAPNFKLKDQKEVEHTLDKLLKQHDQVALVFYRSADW